MLQGKSLLQNDTGHSYSLICLPKLESLQIENMIQTRSRGIRSQNEVKKERHYDACGPWSLIME